MEDGILELLAILKSIVENEFPKLWEICQMQIQSEINVCLGWIGFLVLVILLLSVVFDLDNKLWETGVVAFLCALIIFISLIVLPFLFEKYILLSSNPEYYALLRLSGILGLGQ